MARVPFDPATDYYGLLGVSPGAPPEQIQAAYRRLAKAYHPDLNAGSSVAAARMARVNVAKTVLLDPLTRAAYDQQRGLRARRTAVAQRAARTATVTPGKPPVVSRVASPVQPVGWAATHRVRPDYGQSQAPPPWVGVRRAGAYVPAGVHGRSIGAFDRGTGVLLLITIPLLAALLVYVVQAVQVAGRPLRAGPSDLALPQVVARPTARGTAEAAFLIVRGQPPSRLLGQRAYNLVQNRSDGSPEGELLRAAARRLVQAGAASDVQSWEEAVTELCLLADHC
jgi:DnaJ-like protein